MSAIFGILRFDGAEVNPRELERMSNTLAHRGPDGRKFVVDGPLGLGHCLMRVNNEDRFEAQPLVSLSIAAFEPAQERTDDNAAVKRILVQALLALRRFGLGGPGVE
jgi:asparagine synthase (glutamine-hydrolysing)